ncbi:MAG: HEAT repeat domain-containing protein [Planctomycetota bacterium]
MMRLVVVLLLLAGAAVAAPRENHSWGERVKDRGKHFVVETNTFPEIARDLVARLDRAFVLYEDRFGPLVGRARRPMRVHLFRTRREYMAHGEGVAGALGHFDPSTDVCSLVWSGGTGEAGWPIAIHEACHQYLYRRFGRTRLPSWYAEGIACWFEGVQDKTTSNRVSRIRYNAARAAARNGQAKLDVILDTRALVQRGRLAVAGMTPSRYYGLAWSLVHFLATDPRYAHAFRRFEMRLLAGQHQRTFDARKLLQEECGSLEKLEQEWRAHLDGLQPAPAIVRTPPYAWEFEAENAFVRYSALRRIHRIPFPERFESGIFACLRDGNIAVRTQATRVVKRDPREQGVYALLKSLDWGDPQLKQEALRALGHRSMGRAVPRLLEETEAREGALRALATIGDARAFPALRDAVLDRNLDVTTRTLCVRTLGRDPAARTVLERARSSSVAEIRAEAKRALIRLSKLESAETMVLAAADTAFSRFTTRDLIKIVLDPSEDEELRIRACEQLGENRSRVAIPALKRLCRAGVEPRIRLEAVRALVQITGETRGYAPGQSASDREAAFRAWADGGA